MSNATPTPPAKKGAIAGFLSAVETAAAAGVTGIDNAIENVAAGVGKLLTGKERALAEEALSDVNEGLKADDAATATAAPAAAPVAAS